MSCSISAPGLFTSKDRMTSRRGVAAKSRLGTGTQQAMYCATMSMLYPSWADTGMMGAPSATVPVTKDLIFSYWSRACSSFTRSV